MSCAAIDDEWVVVGLEEDDAPLQAAAAAWREAATRTCCEAAKVDALPTPPPTSPPLLTTHYSAAVAACRALHSLCMERTLELTALRASAQSVAADLQKRLAELRAVPPCAPTPLSPSAMPLSDVIARPEEACARLELAAEEIASLRRALASAALREEELGTLRAPAASAAALAGTLVLSAGSSSSSSGNSSSSEPAREDLVRSGVSAPFSPLMLPPSVGIHWASLRTAAISLLGGGSGSEGGGGSPTRSAALRPTLVESTTSPLRHSRTSSGRGA